MVCRSKNKQKVAEGCFLNKTQTGRSKLNVAAPLPYRVVPYLFWRAWGKQGVSLWALLFPCVWSCLFSFGLQLLIYKMFTTLLQSIWSQTANMQLPLFDYFFFRVHEKYPFIKYSRWTPVHNGFDLYILLVLFSVKCIKLRLFLSWNKLSFAMNYSLKDLFFFRRKKMCCDVYSSLVFHLPYIYIYMFGLNSSSNTF